MGVVRIPAPIFETVQKHLFSTRGEHFAFMLARVASSEGKPVFMVREAILIPDRDVKVTRT